MLVAIRLKDAGIRCEIVRARGEAEFKAALGAGPFDLILSDYRLPSYSGKAALDSAKAAMPKVPFILISGTIGEEAAIDSLLAGATDYVLKAHDMSRLEPAIERALREVKQREDQEKLEAQYRQAQKMEAVGRLAGGVAHDFNNLLTAILGFAELSIKELPEGHAVRADLEEIRDTALRAAQLTRQLLAFSRKQLAQPRNLDLNAAVKNIERMLRRVISEDIELEVRCGSPLDLVCIDPGQLEQLIVNLAVNARDAMPKGGRLTIETRNVALDGEFVARNVGAAPGRYARLTVKDTGTGLSETAQAHLFEPFFTTKEPGRGTGLGLATCYGIVKQNRGYIGVDSEPGRGAAFHIFLPRVEGRPEALGEPAGAPAGGSEAVLLVEDDSALRRLTARMLRSRGYRVAEAGNAAEALRLLAEDRERRLRLLLTDVVMPQGGGKQLADRVRAERPDLKVLFMSGYTDEVISRHGIVEQGVRFLQKPFTLETLSQKVREVLDALS